MNGVPGTRPVSTTDVHPAPADLEPSLIGRAAHYASRRGGRVIDAVTIIRAMLVLLFVLPAGLIVPELTLGRPAGLIIGLGLVFVWVVAKASPAAGHARAPAGPLGDHALHGVHDWSPTPPASCEVCPSWRPTRPTAPCSCTWCLIGIALAAADGVANRSGVDAVIRVFVWCAAIMALVGILQSFVELDLGALVRCPVWSTTRRCRASSTGAARTSTGWPARRPTTSSSAR